MKKLILGFLCSIVFLSLSAQPARLIVRGDDMGCAQAVNEAFVRCYTDGILTSAEVMTVTPWFPQAVKLLKEHPGLDVGVHLTITGEWENIKWRPLTHCPSITGDNGYFYPMIYPHKAYPGQSITEHPYRIEEIEQEFRAQIEMALTNIPWLSHISSHMGCTLISPEINAMTIRLAEEYNLIYLNEVLTPGLNFITYRGPKQTSEEKLASFLSMLDMIEPGKDYLFLDHPALDTPEVRAMWHIGYEDVAVDRQGVTDVFTNEQVKQKIKEKGIELISYSEYGKPLPRETP